MAAVNANTAPILVEGTNITLTQSGQTITVDATSANATVDVFTPSLSSTGSTFSYSSRVGAYAKVGQLILVTFRIALNTSGNTLTGNALTLTGLPFSSANVTNRLFAGDAIWTNFTTSLDRIPFQLPANSNFLTLYKTTAATTNVTTTLKANDMSTTAGSVIYGTLSYITA